MKITIDISDWQSKDWNETIPEMEDWIIENEGDLRKVWPDSTVGILHLSDPYKAFEFMLRWAWPEMT